MTTVVTRKDRLEGVRQIVSGGVDLALAGDRSAPPRARRLNAGFGATGILMGVGQARGLRPLSLGAGAASVAWVSNVLLAEPTDRRSRPERADGGTLAGVGSGRSASRPNGTPTGAFEPHEAAPAVSRRDRLKGAQAIASGVVSLAIATDRSLEARQRRVGVATGALSIGNGVALLRGSERARTAVAGGWLVLFTVALGDAARKAAKRR